MSYTIIVTRNAVDSDADLVIYQEHGDNSDYDTIQLAAKALARLILDNHGNPRLAKTAHLQLTYSVRRITNYPITPETIAELTSDEEALLNTTVTALKQKIKNLA